MATRLYLQATGAAAVTAPALPSGWTAGGTSAIQRKSTTTKANTTLTDFLVAETTASITNIPIGIFITNPLVGGSVSGTFSAVVRGLESATTSDDSLQVGLYLIAGNGSSVLSTLYAGHTTALGAVSGTLGEEFATTAATRRIPSGTAITTQTAATGDRLMVIVGYRAHNTTTASRSSTLRFGDPTAPADFALTAGLTTDLVPWVELSATLTFSDPLIQTVPDALGITDSVQVLTRQIGITEQVFLFDSQTVSLGGAAIARTQTDNLGLTDTSQALARSASIFETLFIPDSVQVDTSTGGDQTRTVNDTLGVDDTPTEEIDGFDVVLVEPLGLTDATTVASVFAPATLTDNLGVTDTAAPASTFPRTQTDNLGLTDAAAVASTFQPVQVDALGVTDTAAVASTFQPTQTDDLGITDTRTVDFITGTTNLTVTDALGVTDATTVEQIKGATPTDALGLTDTAAVASTFQPTQTDSLGVTDTAAAASTFSQLQTEAIGLTDLVTAAITYGQTALDALGLTDSVSVVSVQDRTVTDALGLTDSRVVDASFTTLTTLTDALGLTDSRTVFSTTTTSRTVTDALGLTDAVTAQMVLVSPGSIQTIERDGPRMSQVERTVATMKGVTRV